VNREEGDRVVEDSKDNIVRSVYYRPPKYAAHP
jgi:hypothetical protein